MGRAATEQVTKHRPANDRHTTRAIAQALPIQYQVDKVTVSMICPNIGDEDHLYVRQDAGRLNKRCGPGLPIALERCGAAPASVISRGHRHGIETRTLAEMGQRDAHNALASLVSLYQLITAPIFALSNQLGLI